MAMRTKTKPATVSFPLTGLKPLYRSNRGTADTIVFEADIKGLKEVNEPATIDEMMAEARLEHALGKTKAFNSADELMEDLRS